MPVLRRVVQTVVIAWGAGMAGHIVAASLDLDGALVAALPVSGLILGAIFGWALTRDVAPWTPQDLRDGAVGWGAVGGAVVVLVTVAFTPTDWRVPAGILVALVVLISAFVVHRRADRLGVADASASGSPHA